MIALIQRVSQASVTVNNQSVGAIHQGVLAFVGIQKLDTEATAIKLLKKILSYRVFADEKGQMNLSLTDIKGALLLVPQFTLAADTQKGLRPSFSAAASPDMAKHLFETAVKEARKKHNAVEAGIFGADMQVSLVNDGPVTFWIEVE